MILPNAKPEDLLKHKPLLDALTAHVSLCSGYEIIGVEGDLVVSVFKYPGGKVSLALDPSKSKVHNISMITTAVQLNMWMDTIPKLDLSKVR